MGMAFRGGIIAACLIGASSQVIAGEHVKQLRGIYRGTLHTVCMESPNGFADPPNQVFLGEGNRYADTSTSTAVFSADGTMTEELRGATSFLNGAGFFGAVSVGTFVTTCRYKIDLHSNLAFTSKGACSGNLPTGPGAPNNAQTTDIDGEGQVSEDRSVIIIGTTQPDENNLTLTNDTGNVVYSAKRLCTTTGTYVRLPRQGNQPK